jgi:putative iron-dependent peroxidase
VDASEPQAVLTPITEAAIFLTATVDAGGEDAVRDLLPDVSGLRRSVGFRIPEGELTCVTGIGAALWDRLFGAPRPAGLHPFTELAGPTHTAPATPGDLLFHIRAHQMDLCFELAQRLAGRLAGRARVVDEVHGFRSFDSTAVTGNLFFVPPADVMDDPPAPTPGPAAAAAEAGEAPGDGSLALGSLRSPPEE